MLSHLNETERKEHAGLFYSDTEKSASLRTNSKFTWQKQSTVTRLRAILTKNCEGSICGLRISIALTTTLTEVGGGESKLFLKTVKPSKLNASFKFLSQLF